MDVDTHTVAKSVVVVVAIAGIADDLAREFEDVVALDAGMNGCGTLLMRTAHKRIQIKLLGRGLTYYHGTGHIAAIIAITRTVIHQHEVAALNNAIGRHGVRIGRIGTRSHDRTKCKGIGAVAEHKVLELGTNLLLGQARLDEGEHVLEGGIGDRLRLAHESDLLIVLHGAHALKVMMKLRQTRRDGEVLKGAHDSKIEGNLHVILDGNHTRARIAGAFGDPTGHSALIHVELPGGIGREILLEGIEVARIGMEIALVCRDKGDVRELKGIVERTLCAREPTKVSFVANDHGVVAALLHHLAHARDTTKRPVKLSIHQQSPFQNEVELPIDQIGTRGKIRLRVALEHIIVNSCEANGARSLGDREHETVGESICFAF